MLSEVGGVGRRTPQWLQARGIVKLCCREGGRWCKVEASAASARARKKPAGDKEGERVQWHARCFYVYGDEG